MKGYMYILQCGRSFYYTGSTTNVGRRFIQHQQGEGANFTKKFKPIHLVYVEEYHNIGTAFKREKQIQGWSRKKKEMLIEGLVGDLHQLAECRNDSHFRNNPNKRNKQL